MNTGDGHGEHERLLRAVPSDDSKDLSWQGGTRKVCLFTITGVVVPLQAKRKNVNKSNKKMVKFIILPPRE